MMSDVFAGPTSEICSASWYEEGVAPSHSIWCVPKMSNCVWMFGCTYETMYLICDFVYISLDVCMFVFMYVYVCVVAPPIQASCMQTYIYIYIRKASPTMCETIMSPATSGHARSVDTCQLYNWHLCIASLLNANKPPCQTTTSDRFRNWGTHWKIFSFQRYFNLSVLPRSVSK